MKTIKSIFVGCFALVCSHVFAQEELAEKYPDTLKIVTESDTKIIFSFNRISDREDYFNNEFWRSALNIMETAINRTSLEGGLAVTYRKVIKEDDTEARISVVPIDPPGDLIVIKNNQAVNYEAERVEYQLLLEKVAVSFSITNSNMLEEVKSMNVESIWSQIAEKYTNEGKVNLYSATGKVKFDKVTIDEIVAAKPRLDQLEITFLGIGLGYYRDQFVPDLGSKLSIHMYDRLGNDWMEYGVLYTRQYFFSRDESNDYDVDSNGFLTGFWKIKSKTEGEFGIGIGGLIHQQGDFYEGSTWKLSLYSQGANSTVTFSPEIIFTNDFKDVFPALRFGMSF